MSKVRVHIMMSLDGYVAGPNMSQDKPFGEGADGLAAWYHDLRFFRETHGLKGGTTGPSDDVVRETADNLGAHVIGHNMFGPWPGPGWRGWWGENPPFHAPVFVLTHHRREPLEMLGGTTFYFVTDGIESAVRQARQAAGEKDVRIGGGASVVSQALAAGLIDELQLHLTPVLVGGGPRLFEGLGAAKPALRLIHTVPTPEVTHLTYAVRR